MTKRNEHMLSGYRILDLTRAVAGPTCTRMFAEMGADVIKVEGAPDGDMARSISKIRNERSLYIIQQSLNKKRIGRINALFTQVQQLWTAVDSFDTPAMQPNPADGEPATLKIYPPLSH